MEVVAVMAAVAVMAVVEVMAVVGVMDSVATTEVATVGFKDEGDIKRVCVKIN